MNTNMEENLQWLENLFKEAYPKIKMLKKEVSHDYAYAVQVEIDGKVINLEFRRSLVDDRLVNKILSIIRERLG